jgi:hypothetical protein
MQTALNMQAAAAAAGVPPPNVQANDPAVQSAYMPQHPMPYYSPWGPAQASYGPPPPPQHHPSQATAAAPYGTHNAPPMYANVQASDMYAAFAQQHHPMGATSAAVSQNMPPYYSVPVPNLPQQGGNESGTHGSTGSNTAAGGAAADQQRNNGHPAGDGQYPSEVLNKLTSLAEQLIHAQKNGINLRMIQDALSQQQQVAANMGFNNHPSQNFAQQALALAESQQQVNHHFAQQNPHLHHHHLMAPAPAGNQTAQSSASPQSHGFTQPQAQHY